MRDRERPGRHGAGAHESGPGPDVLEVLDGGVLATIQDEGRFGHEAEGVPRSGAADPIGLAVANVLLGNPVGAAAVEATFAGLRVRALVDVDVGLGGADLGALIGGADGEATPDAHRGAEREAAQPGTSVRLRAGQVLSLRGASSEEEQGCRAYLAVPGGIDVPVVLGSRSTCLPAAFGGLDGRALRAGDRIRAVRGTAARPAPAHLAAQALADLPSPAQRLRVLPGPASDEGDPAFAGIVGRPWIVTATSDRRGLRLEAAEAGADDPAALAPLAAGELPSHGVLPGAIQVTPSGQPLVLMADAGTTGGYPVVAVVIRADVPLLGQLVPGVEVRFRATTPEAAREAEEGRRAVIAHLASRLS